MAKTKRYATPSYLKPFNAEEENRKLVMSKVNYNTPDYNHQSAIELRNNEYKPIPKSVSNPYKEYQNFRNNELKNKIPTPSYLKPLKTGKWGQTNLTPIDTNKTVGVGKTGAVKIAPRAFSSADALVTGALDGASLGTVNGGLNKLTGQQGNMSDDKHNVAYQAGKFAGYALPVSKATKALKPVLKGITKPLLNRLAEGAIIGGGMTAVEDTANSKGLKQTAKDVGINMALGGALDTALYGALDMGLLDKGLRGIGKGISKLTRKPAGDVLPNSKVIEPPITKQSTQELKNDFDKNNFDGVINRIKNTEYLQEQDKLKTEANKLPKINNEITPNTKISEFKTNTLENSPFLADKETQKVINSIDAQYEVKPNKQTIEKATKELKNNFDGVVNRIKNTEVVSGKGALNSAEDSAAAGLITRELRLKAEQTGDYTKLKAWIEELQPKVTNTAQSLQALKTWKDLSPEGTIFKAQQVVGQVNREGTKLYGKNFKPTELTTDEMKFINDKMTEVGKMPTDTPSQLKAQEREFAKVKKVIADKVPATLADKVKGLQRISLLLNPKTNIRNVLGNTILGVLENTKDFVSAPLDKLISLKTGERTTLLPSLEGIKTQGKGMVQGVKTVIGDYKQGVNTSQSVGQFDITGNRIFKNNTLNKFENLTNTALRFGDEPFYQAAYNESLRQQMKIANVSEPTEAMIEKATELAKNRTLQNNSALAEGFTKLQKSINKMTGNENLGIGTFAVPFTKTPANILDKAIDYTPIGSLKSISQLISNKTFNQKLFVDRIGRSAIGTGGIMLGYDLAKKGLITGKANKDKDVAALDKQTGKSAYAFKTGDTYRTFDWAQPAAIPLAIGADIYQEGKDRKDAANVSIEAFKSGGTTLFNQSLLQGIQRMFGSGGLVEGLASTTLNIPTQFVPSALKQATQLTDKTLRDTYDPNPANQVLNQIKAKIPGLSTQLQPRVDTLGRDLQQFQGKNNITNVLLNPGFTTKNNSSNAEKLALSLYEQTGSKAQFPRVANNTITYRESYDKNKTIKLTPSEKTELQRYIGNITNTEYERLYENESFNNKTVENKVKYLQSLLTRIYNNGEQEILKSRGIKEYGK